MLPPGDRPMRSVQMAKFTYDHQDGWKVVLHTPRLATTEQAEEMLQEIGIFMEKVMAVMGVNSYGQSAPDDTKDYPYLLEYPTIEDEV